MTLGNSQPFNSGEQSVENAVIEDAVEMLEQLKHLEKNEKSRAWIIKVVILFLGFATTSAAVVYEEFRVNYNSFAKSELQAITVILPVILGVFLTIGQTWESNKRWSILKLTGAKVEREICRYECRVGEYKALVGNGPVHRENFTTRINQIWSRIDSNDLARQSLVGSKLSRSRKKVDENGLRGLSSPMKKNIEAWKKTDRARKKRAEKKEKKRSIGLAALVKETPRDPLNVERRLHQGKAGGRARQADETAAQVLLSAKVLADPANHVECFDCNHGRLRAPKMGTSSLGAGRHD